MSGFKVGDKVVDSEGDEGVIYLIMDGYMKVDYGNEDKDYWMSNSSWFDENGVEEMSGITIKLIK